MADKIFIDSYLFLYTLDSHDPQKRDHAKSLLLEASRSHRLFISTQVLNEVFAVATRKLGVDAVTAKEFVHALRAYHVLLITPELIDSAIDCAILQRLNYWDALMIAAAEAGKCSILWTEDLRHSAVIRSVEIVNPFLGK